MKTLLIKYGVFVMAMLSSLSAQIAIKVDATLPWTDTGISISAGETVLITAFGRYMEANSPQNPAYWIGPEGFPEPTSYSSNSSAYPMPDAAARCLIGKIGDNLPFVVGSKTMQTFSESGRLFLQVNDINFGNNDGYLVAYITILPGFAKAIKVDITQPWTDTGLEVVASDKIMTVGYGIYNEGGIEQDIESWIGPSGHPLENKSAGNYPIPDARARGLIGKIGENGDPFIVGDYCEKEIENSGKLYLGLNDINFSNNQGYCIVFLVHNPISPLIDTQTLVGNDFTHQNSPSEFKLLSNYPNPFNPQTRIVYSLEKNTNVRLEIFSVTGERVRTLFEGHQSPGIHNAIWNGISDDGAQVASGQYFYRIEVDGESVTKKALLVR